MFEDGQPVSLAAGRTTRGPPWAAITSISWDSARASPCGGPLARDRDRISNL